MNQQSQSWAEWRQILLGFGLVSLVALVFVGMQLSPVLGGLMLLSQAVLSLATGVGFVVLAIAGVCLVLALVARLLWRGLCRFGNWLGRP